MLAGVVNLDYRLTCSCSNLAVTDYQGISPAPAGTRVKAGKSFAIPFWAVGFMLHLILYYSRFMCSLLLVYTF